MKLTTTFWQSVQKIHKHVSAFQKNPWCSSVILFKTKRYNKQKDLLDGEADKAQTNQGAGKSPNVKKSQSPERKKGPETPWKGWNIRHTRYKDKVTKSEEKKHTWTHSQVNEGQVTLSSDQKGGKNTKTGSKVTEASREVSISK